jgi:hypothetical protein
VGDGEAIFEEVGGGEAAFAAADPGECADVPGISKSRSGLKSSAMDSGESPVAEAGEELLGDGVVLRGTHEEVPGWSWSCGVAAMELQTD